MTAINTTLIFSTQPSTAERIAENLAPQVRHIHRADNVDQALIGLSEKIPDVVLVDLAQNPGDGLSLTRRLRCMHPGLPILAVGAKKDPDLILAGLRAGMSDYLVLGKEIAGMAEALGNVLNHRAGRDSSGELIAVYSLKGGQGVTTVAVNLADQIQALTGRKVLLADLHLYRGDAAVYLNPSNGYSPFELVRDLERMDEDLLFSSLAQPKDKLYLLATSGDINDADQVSPEDLAAMMAFLKNHFGTIVADLPCDCSAKNIAVLDAATRIVLVVQQTVAEIKSLQSVIDFFRDINPREQRLEIIINRFNKNSDLAPGELADLFGCPITGMITNDYKAVTRAIDQGRPLATSCPRKRISRDFKALASRLCGMDTARPQRPLVKAITGWIKG